MNTSQSAADLTLNGDDHNDQGSADVPPGATTRGTPDTRHIRMTANRLNAGELFAAAREIAIEHGNEIYRLRLTAQNKLILTK